MTAADVRQQAIEVLGKLAPKLGESKDDWAKRAADRLITAGVIRETDNTGNDAVGPRCHLHPEGCPATHRQRAERSTKTDNTTKPWRVVDTRVNLL